MNFAHALKWSFLGELAAKAVQPVVFIVLARLLTPEDFGVMTAAMMVIAFSQIFWEAGMGKALIQRQTEVEQAANAAFWINLGLGAVIAGLLYAFAQTIAVAFFKDDRVTAVLQVMTLQVLLGALSSVQTALLQKAMDFKKLFWVRLTTVALPGLVSIPLAWNGWGYWALVVGTIFGQLAQVIMLWGMSSWRPGIKITLAVGEQMARFGIWVGATGLLSWFYVWADSLIVAYYLGNHALGLYRVGSQFVTLVFASISAPIIPVFYGWLTSNRALDYNKILQHTISLCAIIFLPLSILMFSQASWLSSVFFTIQWRGLDSVIGLMALASGFSYLLIGNSEIFRAVGKPQFETYPMFFGVVIFLPIYILSVQHGLEAFLYTRLLLVVFVGFNLHVVLAKLCVNLKPWVLLRYEIFGGAIFIILIFSSTSPSNIIKQIIGFILFLLLMGLLFKLERSFYVNFYKNNIRKTILSWREVF